MTRVLLALSLVACGAAPESSPEVPPPVQAPAEPEPTPEATPEATPPEGPVGLKQAVLAMWRDNGPTLQACHAARLADRPDLRGTWNVRFMVETDGEINDAVANGADMADAALEDCLTGKVDSWSLDIELPKRRPVKLPLRFE